MPLTIAYRPVILPAPAAARAVVRAAGPELRPRDFTARIRKKDAVSIRRVLAGPRIWRQRLGGIAAIGALGMLLGPVGWGQPGGIEAAEARTSATVPQPFERPGESFPGSAFYYLDAADSGLIAPAAAASAWAAHRDDDTAAGVLAPSGPAARPILATGGAEDRWRALQCLTAAVYYEAASEPDAGQSAVAQVVLNRVAHPAYPNTVCGVVYQGSERPGCQFSFACDGSLARRPVPQFWERARRTAAAALAGYVYAPVGLATHYHTTAVHPYWADSLAFIGVIGAHRFYRWQGKAGRPAAFTAVYAGGEPVAAPHPRSWTPLPAGSSDPLALAQAYEEGRLAALGQAAQAPAVPGQGPLAQPQASTVPAFAPAAADRGGDAQYRARPLNGSGTIRPEYEAAGTWIAQPTG